MTISIKVSCNGSYKCPVKVEQGTRTEEFVLSGRDKAGPDERSIPFYHGTDPMSVTIGPEVYDNGESEGTSE